MNSLLQDLRYGLRMLAKKPGFTAVAVVTLALGIGVNTAIFTVYNVTALRPLQVPDPGRIVNLYLSNRNRGFVRSFSYPDYVYYSENNRVFSGIIASSIAGFELSAGPDSAKAVSVAPSGVATLQLSGKIMPRGADVTVGLLVSENYFEVLGVPAALGRTFLTSDNRGPGSDPFVLLSYNFWQRRFNSDLTVIGKPVRVNGIPMTVIGITPRNFAGTSMTVPDIWAPMMMQAHLQPGQDWLHDRKTSNCLLYGRLKLGVRPEQAAEEMTALGHRLRETYSDVEAGTKGAHFVLTRGSAFGPPLSGEDKLLVMSVLAAVGLVLLIACANVAGLMLARAVARQKEIAVRLTMGASRFRLVRQMLTESILLAIAGGGVGLVIAYWILGLLVIKASEVVPEFMNTWVPTSWGIIAPHLAPDVRVLSYTLLLSFIASVGFGLAPALRSTKPALALALNEQAARFAVPFDRAHFRFRLHDMLIAAQVAVCLIFLVTAGLLARGSHKALTIDLGFNPKGLVVLQTGLGPESQYNQARKAEIQSQLLERLRALPGVRSVAVGGVPLHGGVARVPISTDLGQPPNRVRSPELHYNVVSPSYFDTIGIPILRGRKFTEQEAKTGAAVVVVSEATARRLWPGQDPIGKLIRYGNPQSQPHSGGGSPNPFSAGSMVIGVVRDIRSMSLFTLDENCLYLPLRPAEEWGAFLMRTEVDPKGVEAHIPDAVQSIDSNLTGGFLEETAVLTNNNAQFLLSRVSAILSGCVGLLGLLLAAAGIYGMVSFGVTQRTHEIGVRMALGARRADVFGLVLRESMRPVALGMVFGLAGAAAISQVLVSLLFGLSTLDTPTFLGVCSFLLAASLLAGYVPARRATKVDPMVALRYE